MLWVDSTECVGVESSAVGSDWVEESIVGIKHLLCKSLEPFASNSTSVDTLFTVESDAELAVFHLIWGLVVEMLE